LAKEDVDTGTPSVDDEFPETMIVTAEGVLELPAVLLLELRIDVVGEDGAIVGDEFSCEDADSDVPGVDDEFPGTMIVMVEDVVEISTVLLLELGSIVEEEDEPDTEDALADEDVDSDGPNVLDEFPETTIVTTLGLGISVDVLLLELNDDAIEEDEADEVLELSEVLLPDSEGNAVDEEEAPVVESVPAMVSDDVVDPGREVVLEVLFSPTIVDREVVCEEAEVQSIHLNGATEEVGAGDHAGPLLWQGAPYSQQAKVVFDEFRLDEVDWASMIVVVVSVQVVVLANFRAK